LDPDDKDGAAAVTVDAAVREATWQDSSAWQPQQHKSSAATDGCSKTKQQLVKS
jgi:hypothetical protein